MLILAGVVAEALVAQPTLAVGARQLVRSRGVLLQAEQAERPAPFAGFFQRDDDVPVDQQPVYELQVICVPMLTSLVSRRRCGRGRRAHGSAHARRG